MNEYDPWNEWAMNRERPPKKAVNYNEVFSFYTAPKQGWSQ